MRAVLHTPICPFYFLLYLVFMPSQARTTAPIISNSMAVSALVIHIAISMITIQVNAVIGSGYLNQDFIREAFSLIFSPIIVALMLTPIVVLARHTSFLPEFRTLLFLCIGADILITLLKMTGFAI